MSTRKKIIWMDDNPSRATTAGELGARFINVKDKDLAEETRKLLDGPSPQLVIIDHVLDKTVNPHPVFLKGSTIAEAIKEKWPTCAVVGVTNADALKEIDLRTKGTYDALFRFHNFGDYFSRIRGIARGFALVGQTSPDAKKLIRLLKPPENEHERLEEALSNDLKNPSGGASSASLMYQWVEHIVGRPGFLFDRLWSATFLGLNEDGFTKVEGKFGKAKYKGIFARPDDPRWWSKVLSDVLYKYNKAQIGEFSWQAGRRLPGIGKNHFSSCHYCREEYPEIVAYLDEVGDEQRAMHLKCTVLHPRYPRELYFEDIRVMQGND